MDGWRDGLGPWTPVVEGDRLYGRGGADDGYAAFASLAAIEAVQRGRRCPHPLRRADRGQRGERQPRPARPRRGAAPSGSARPRSCCASTRAASTTSGCGSPRRCAGWPGGTLVVDILDEGVHSGAASGVVPSTFRIARQLLDRVEDAITGEIRLAELHVPIPDGPPAPGRRHRGRHPQYSDRYHFVPGAGPVVLDPVEQILNHTWRPTLSVVGADGLPPTTRPATCCGRPPRSSSRFRLPPTCDPDAARSPRSTPPSPRTRRTAPRSPSPAARPARAGTRRRSRRGWRTSLQRASQATFGRPARAFGEGGTIPFMGMLGQRFPDAQFVITGVLGPDSNAHGPNEYLHLPSAERITAALAMVLDDHARR